MQKLKVFVFEDFVHNSRAQVRFKVMIVSKSMKTLMLRSWEYLETSPDLAAVTGAHYLLSNESKTFKKMKYGMFQLD